jgi:hypothetical protein
MMELKMGYLNFKQARALRLHLRADTTQGKRVRTELIDIVTMWMNSQMLPADCAPMIVKLLRNGAVVKTP